MSREDPHVAYQQRRVHWSATIARAERRHLLVSNLRLAASVVAAAAAWLAFARGTISPSWVLIPVLCFLALIAVHARILNERDRATRARRYFERGSNRLAGIWVGEGADGARFLEGHSYARDLDLFGRGSLFQLLNTACTESGETTLAAWLRTWTPVPEVEARQAAVEELAGRLDVRETLAVHGAEAKVERTGTLATWASAPPVGLGARHAVVFAGCAAVTIVLGALTAAGWWPSGFLIGWVVIQSGIAVIWRHEVGKVIRGVDAVADDLATLSGLLQRVEREVFTSPRLRALHEVLVVGDLPPSRRIARLQTCLAARDSLRNEFVRPFALLLLVRSQSAVAIDRWHAAHGAQLAAWVAAVGEFEALASLATYAFEHPTDPFPTMRSAGPVFDAVGLAHPLIPSTEAVPNDVRIGGAHPRALVVSGSNMSGKSTLLRAVGANAVLAMAGGPVRAESLVMSSMTIGATLRVEDSLLGGQSSFYAEILRIRDIVSSAGGDVPVLFLLDEILHGTNSHDRRIGAEAIVRALVDAGAIGLVTTHDLALTALADTMEGRARNVHFADRIEGGRMVFDYQMRDGVVTRSNALELMRAVGLKV